MFRLSRLACLALSTTLFCAVWSNTAWRIGLWVWAGFAGCTCYFACPEKGMKAVGLCYVNAFTGFLYAIGTLALDQIFPSTIGFIIIDLVLVFFMCYQAKIKLLSYTVGVFFGCFPTRAVDGNPKILICLAIGVILGLLCDKGGSFLYSKFGAPEIEADVAESANVEV